VNRLSERRPKPAGRVAEATLSHVKSGTWEIPAAILTRPDTDFVTMPGFSGQVPDLGQGPDQDRGIRSPR